ILAVVFDNEKKAYEGKTALHQVGQDGDIVIYGGAVVTKHADGTASVKEFDDFGGTGAIAGTALGSLIGLLGGPVGMLVGAGTGLAVGAIADVAYFENARVGEDFVADILKSLTPNKVAVVVEADEDWTTPVDARMETIGGTVYRRSMWEVRENLHQKEIAAMKADLAQLKAEQTKVNAERKAKLQKRIDQLQAKIEAQQTKAKERQAAFEARQKSKSEVLKNNAKAAGRALKQLANTPV
ncbi:MAG TPA: DUF1269 domain-containing protein, partial [Thermoanaerobaculia bacterium]|nr:DUF1269 domain-containing protein [Thermoanaerobaculia bacterium]